jgi:hypothetical protein
MEDNGLVEVSAIAGSSKSDRVLLVLDGSPTKSPSSRRVVYAHLVLCSSSATASGCSDSASDCIESESESKSSESSELELSSQKYSTCACSSS